MNAAAVNAKSRLIARATPWLVLPGIFFWSGIAPQLNAAFEPATIQIPVTKVWTGQRAIFFVELRARGSFDGTPNFALPQLPRTLIMAAGRPVVSSEEHGGETWFVQRYEFALFSQQSGTLQLPAFTVHFSAHEGYTGPVHNFDATVPACQIEIERPPGSASLGFVVTTESLELTETWDPLPGPVTAGAVFKRTIVQQADQLTGMALAPASQRAPEGVRVYAGQPEVTDNTERGAFRGTRRETLTYLMEQPGTVVLPEIKYFWWNPKALRLESKTLPAAMIEVAALPVTETTPMGDAVWPWWLAASLALVLLTIWQKSRLTTLATRIRKKLNPPHRAAARALLRACRDNDAPATNAAWFHWLRVRPPGFESNPALQAELLRVQRHLFGPDPQRAWNGAALAQIFRKSLQSVSTAPRHGTPLILPGLNP